VPVAPKSPAEKCDLLVVVLMVVVLVVVVLVGKIHAWVTPEVTSTRILGASRLCIMRSELPINEPTMPARIASWHCARDLTK